MRWQAACLIFSFIFSSQAQTAYFVITPSTQHGEDLVCSYEICKEAGSKFSFCAYCRIPVAKRGFKHHCLQSGHDDGSSEKPIKPTKQLSKNDAPRDEHTNDDLLRVRMEKWDKLLESRPSKYDSERLASWIKQVFDVSSIGTVMDGEGGAGPSGIARSEEEVIAALIDSFVSNLETTSCDSKDMNQKESKKRKISF